MKSYTQMLHFVIYKDQGREASEWPRGKAWHLSAES